MIDADLTEPDDGALGTGRWIRFTAIGVTGLFLLLLVVTLGSRFGTDPRLVESPLIGEPAPSISLDYLERQGSWNLDDHAGHVVIVNFWASWCVGCRLEHDDLLETAATFREQGVVLLGVTFPDDPAESIAFLDELGRGYDSVIDPGSRVAVEYGVFGIPETFIIDGHGIVRAKIAGESTIEALTAQIVPLLETVATGSR
ncbi:redoxin domain-containing protein [bacterium]|nr:redoxin domain-containing protein [bacterium]